MQYFAQIDAWVVDGVWNTVRRLVTPDRVLETREDVLDTEQDSYVKSLDEEINADVRS